MDQDRKKKKRGSGGGGGCEEGGVVEREIITEVCKHNHKYLQSVCRQQTQEPVFIRDSIRVFST